MAKYIVVECNRLNSQSNYGNLNESEDIYKNTWVNNISSTGIEIEAGDNIACESVAVNNVGASDEVMEFIGNTSQGFLDNKVNLTASYYVNNSGRNTAQLPFNGYKTINTYIPAISPAVTNENRALMYNRQLGQPNLELPTPSDPTKTYTNATVLPADRFLFNIVINDPAGEGYQVGEELITFTVFPANPNSEGLILKILDVEDTSVGGGIPTKIQVVRQGSGYEVGQKLTDATPALPGKVKVHLSLTILNYPNYFTKNYEGQPDGERYYLGNIEYTGNLIKYDGIPKTTSLDTDSINSKWDERDFNIDLEVPIGFNTPDNIGGILTDTLHKPLRYDFRTDLSKWKFISPQKVKVPNVFINGVSPNIIQTPTYQPIACNGNGYVANTNTNETLTGALHSFYLMTAWAEPLRLKYLSQLNTLYFGTSQADAKNEIFTGRPSTMVDFVGDLGNQRLGEYGLTPRILNTFAFASIPSPDFPNKPYTWIDETDYLIKYNKGGLIVTTAFYDEESVKKFADILHGSEEYYGDRSQKVNINSDDYHKNLAVILDLGKYNDESSKGFNSTGATTRYRYSASRLDRSVNIATETETVGTTQLNVQSVVEDWNVANRPVVEIPAKGYQTANNNFDSNYLNDGNQLSQIVVSSRWDDSYKYDTVNPNVDYDETYDYCVGDFSLYTSPPGYFNSGYDGVSYETMIGWAKKYDVAVFPVYPTGVYLGYTNGTTEYITNIDNNGIGKPFLAFRNHFQLGGDEDFDFIKNSGDWKIDAMCALPGQFIGYDCSFIRNKACQVFNPQTAVPATSGDSNSNKTFNPIMYVGAVNPSIQYSSLLSRFEISGLNTPMTLGNGKLTDLPNWQEANDNPEQIVFFNSVKGAIFGAITTLTDPIVDQYNINQRPNTLIDSQSGISITGIGLYKTNTQELVNLKNTDYHIFTNTLFQKMGFDLNQLLPLSGNAQAIFVSKLPITQTNLTYQDSIFNVVNPVTTGAYISSAEFQTLSVNSRDYPLYDLGGDTLQTVQPDVSQANIVGQRLPQKLDFPYLCVYSSIVAGGTDTLYIGSGNGKQLIPCMAFVTRNYSSGDFFYGLEQSFNYTATKNFTITDITTDIRLPDGTRPQLQPHSSVIYKITKTQNGLPAIPPPLEIKKKMSVNNKYDKRNDDDRRARIKKAI